jgi:hypothetical protein
MITNFKMMLDKLEISEESDSLKRKKAMRLEVDALGDGTKV